MTNENNAWLDELIAWADENKIPKKQFPRGKKAILNLTSLDLRGNKLNTIPESIGNLTNLTGLYLWWNQLSELPASIGNLTNLTELGLSYNQLSTLPESFGNLTNLKKLSLLGNKLRFSESIGDLSNLGAYQVEKILQQIAVSNDAWLDELIAWADENEIDEEILPRNKKALLNLTSLDLNDCELSTLPESIGNLTNLTTLYLSDNQLDTLPESIGNLTNLKILDLRNNSFYYKSLIPKSVWDLIGKNRLECFGFILWHTEDEDEDEDDCEGREVTLVKKNSETTVYFYSATVTLESGDENLSAKKLWDKYDCEDFASLDNEKITDNSNEYDIED